jgi:hypothetical protein
MTLSLTGPLSGRSFGPPGLNRRNTVIPHALLLSKRLIAGLSSFFRVALCEQACNGRG